MISDDDLLHDLPHRRSTAASWLHHRFPGTVVSIDRVTRSSATDQDEADDYMEFLVKAATGDVVADFGLTLQAFTAGRPADLPFAMRRPLSATRLSVNRFFVGFRDGRLRDLTRPSS